MNNSGGIKIDIDIIYERAIKGFTDAVKRAEGIAQDFAATIDKAFTESNIQKQENEIKSLSDQWKRLNAELNLFAANYKKGLSQGADLDKDRVSAERLNTAFQNGAKNINEAIVAAVKLGSTLADVVSYANRTVTLGSDAEKSIKGGIGKIVNEALTELKKLEDKRVNIDLGIDDPNLSKIGQSVNAFEETVKKKFAEMGVVYDQNTSDFVGSIKAQINEIVKLEKEYDVLQQQMKQTLDFAQKIASGEAGKIKMQKDPSLDPKFLQAVSNAEKMFGGTIEDNLEAIIQDMMQMGVSARDIYDYLNAIGKAPGLDQVVTIFSDLETNAEIVKDRIREIKNITAEGIENIGTVLANANKTAGGDGPTTAISDDAIKNDITNIQKLEAEYKKLQDEIKELSLEYARAQRVREGGTFRGVKPIGPSKDEIDAAGKAIQTAFDGGAKNIKEAAIEAMRFGVSLSAIEESINDFQLKQELIAGVGDELKHLEQQAVDVYQKIHDAKQNIYNEHSDTSAGGIPAQRPLPALPFNLTGATSAIPNVGTAATQAATATNNLGANIQNNVVQPAKAATPILQSLANNIINLGNSIKSGVAQSFTTFATNVQTGVNAVKQFGQSLAQNIGTRAAQTIDNIKGGFQELQVAGKQIAKDFKDMFTPQNVKDQRAQYVLIGNEINRLFGILNKLKTSYESVAGGETKWAEAIPQITADSNDVNKTLNLMHQALFNGAKSWQEAATKALAAGASFDTVAKALTGLGEKFKQGDAAAAIKILEEELKRLKNAQDAVGESLIKTKSKTQVFIENFLRVKVVNEIVNQLMNLVRQIPELFKKINEITIQFAQAQFTLAANVASTKKVLGESAPTLNQWQQTIKRLRTELSIFSEVDITKAVNQVSVLTRTLGLNKDEQEQVIKIASTLSQTTGVDLSQGIDDVTKALGGSAVVMDKYGVFIRDTDKAAAAFELGFTDKLQKGTQALTSQEVALATLKAILTQVNPMFDELNNYADTLPGRTKEADAAIEDSMNNMNDGLIQLDLLFKNMYEGLLNWLGEIVTQFDWLFKEIDKYNKQQQVDREAEKIGGGPRPVIAEMAKNDRYKPIWEQYSFYAGGKSETKFLEFDYIQDALAKLEDLKKKYGDNVELDMYYDTTLAKIYVGEKKLINAYKLAAQRWDTAQNEAARKKREDLLVRDEWATVDLYKPGAKTDGLSDKEAELVQKTGMEIFDLREQLNADLIAADQKYVEDEQKIWDDYNLELLKLADDRLKDLAKAEEDLTNAKLDAEKERDRAIEDLDRKQKKDSETAEEEHTDKIKEIYEDYYKDLDALNNQYFYDLEDAIAENDVIAIKKLERKYNLDKQKLDNNLTDKLNDEDKSYTQKIEDLKTYEEEERKTIEINYKRALEDAAEQYKKQIAQAEKNYNDELIKQNIHREAMRSELKASYDAERELLNQHFKDKIIDLASNLAGEVTQYKLFFQALEDEFGAFVGSSGPLDKLEEEVFRRAQAMKGALAFVGAGLNPFGGSLPIPTEDTSSFGVSGQIGTRNINLKITTEGLTAPQMDALLHSFNDVMENVLMK